MTDRSPNSRFSDEDVLAIRALEGKVRARTVADMYDVGVETIRKIWRRETFRHVGRDSDGKTLAQGQLDLGKPLAEESDDGAALASMQKLSELLREEKGGVARDLLDEMGETE